MFCLKQYCKVVYVFFFWNRTKNQLHFWATYSGGFIPDWIFFWGFFLWIGWVNDSLIQKNKNSHLLHCWINQCFNLNLFFFFSKKTSIACVSKKNAHFRFLRLTISDCYCNFTYSLWFCLLYYNHRLGHNLIILWHAGHTVSPMLENA